MVALFMLVLSSSQAQQMSASEKIDYVKKVATATIAWESVSSSGASAELVEVERRHNGDKLALAYNLKARGLPKDRLYKLVAWPISMNMPKDATKGVSLSKEGFAICEGLTTEQCKLDPLDPRIRLIFPAVANGEIIRVGLMSLDNQYRAFTALVPNPIVGNDNGCSLEAIRLLPTFTLAMIRTKGLKANEEVTLSSNSAGEIVTEKGKADDKGNYFFTLLPGTKGYNQGTDEITLKASACSPKVSFQWSTQP